MKNGIFFPTTFSFIYIKVSHYNSPIARYKTERIILQGLPPLKLIRYTVLHLQNTVVNEMQPNYEIIIDEKIHWLSDLSMDSDGDFFTNQDPQLDLF